MKRSQVISIIVVTAVLLVGVVYIAFARGNANPGVLPPTSRVQGLTYGEWLAKWWNYALIMPTAENPLTGGTGENCVFQRIGNVGLVVANSTLDVPIKCEVPTGMKLYLEVLGAECSNLEESPFYGGNEAELRACAQSFVPEDLQASIDGVEVQNLSKYIFTSPLYEFTEPEDNILGVPAGTTGKSIGSGAYLMLGPFSPGKHTIHVKGTYPNLDYTADKTFDLTVTR
jgi:hypothetical protein